MDETRPDNRPSSWWVDYAVAIAAVAVATGVRLALDPALGDVYPFVTYFGAVAVVAWFGRTPSAVFTLVLSGLLAFSLFVSPSHPFPASDPGVWLGMGLFVVVAAALVAMSHSMRAARSRAEQLLAGALVGQRELQQSVQAEAEQRERLRITVASIGDAVITTDTAGHVTNLNTVAERLTGWTNADAAGQPLEAVFCIVNETTRQPVENPAARALREGVVVGLANHTVLIGKDTTERPIDDSAAPIRSATGEVVGCVLVFRDITERHRQEAQLRASEARFRELADAVPQIVYETNADGRIGFANRQWRDYTGQGDAQVADLGSVVHPDDLGEMVRQWDAARAAGTTLEAEFRLRRATDGAYRWFLTRSVPVRDEAGRVVKWFGTSTDIHDQKQTEREVVRLAAESERQRRLYETVLTNTPDFVYVFSLDHRVLYANDALVTMWGRGLDGAIGKTFLEIGYEPWHAEMHSREIDQVRATRQPIRGEVPFTGTNGLRQYDYIFVPVIGADGEVEAVAGTTRDVTERKETERQLRESEERSAFVRRSSGVGFWYCDLPFDVLLWDDLVKAHFHLPPDAAATIHTFYDRLHPDDRAPTRRAIERSIADRTPYHVDYRTIDPDTGAMKWVRAIGRTFYAADGTPTRFDGVTLDVSEQKRAEERQAFVMRLADTLRPLADPIEVQAEASRVLGEHLGANRVVYFEIRGHEYVVERDYTAGVGALTGRYPVAAFGPALLGELLDGRTVIEADATNEPGRPAGERAAFAGIQVRGHVDVPLVKDGRFVAGMTVQVSERRDWTRDEVALIEDTAERTWAAVERVRTEAALRISEEGRRLALDAAELGTFNIDPATSALTTDERFRMIVAGTTTAMDYEQAFAAIHPDDRARIREAVAAATRSDGPSPYAEEYRVVQPDGSVRWVFAQGRASYNRQEPGRIVSLDGTVADITARKVAEVEREQLVGQLRDQDRRKDEFLATLAHELRNPLAPISNGLQVIRMTGADGTIEQVRSMMERQLGQLTRLVDDLLDVSRVTSGRLELRKQRVALRAIIDAAVETSRPAIEQAGHELAVAVPEAPIVVDGDPLRLAQVVANLLTNSARYTRPGGHIRVVVTRDDATAVVTVADDGIGIPPAMLDAVFGMFTQVDRTLERTTGGLGIGLSLVKGLVEMHGGRVEARSEGEGQGSEFSVRLPLALPAREVEPAAAASAAIVPPGLRRVLVVDDNVDSSDSLAQLLEVLGNQVRAAYDGEAGVEAARLFRPDLVLCDIGMPKVNGYDVARRIRSETWGQKTVLVALTGWGQDDDRKKSADAGFDHHLVKPVDETALQALLARVSPDAGT